MLKQGKTEDAIKIYTAILSIFPGNTEAKRALTAITEENTTADQTQSSEDWRGEYAQVLELFEQGFLDEACTRARLAANLFPNAYLIWELLGITSQRLGNHNAAKTAFQTGVALDPSNARAYNNLGLILNETGDNRAALDALHTALRLDSSLPDTHYNFGTVYKNIGQLEKAKSAFKQAIKIDPKNAEAHNNLGYLLSQEGRNDEALRHFEQAVKHRAGFAQAHFNLGVTLESMRQVDRAIHCYQKALKIEPNYPNALNNLGVAYRHNGNLEMAEATLTLAVSREPNSPQSFNNLGNALLDLGKTQQAIKAYERAILLDAEYAEAYNNLGSALRALPAIDDAQSKFEQAIKLRPSYAEAHNNLGIILSDKGASSAALKCFQTAIKQSPAFGSAWRNLLTSFPSCADSKSLATLLEIWSNDALDDRNKCEVAFALFETYKKLGDPGAAFQYLEIANDMRARDLRYDVTADIELITWLRALSTSWPQEIREIEQEYPAPVFIVGMPRSGTTLVEQILSSHSDVEGLGELPHVNDFIKPKLKSGAGATECLSGLRKHYYSRALAKPIKTKRFTDKLPLNFLWIPALLNIHHDTKIVHVYRDAAATCWSNYEKYFPSKGLGFTYGLDTVTRYFSLYLELMSDYSSIFSDRIYHQSYEALTENPEKEISNLAQYVGLKLEDAMFAPHLNPKPVSTASNMQVRQKIYRGSSTNWKIFAKYLGGAFDKLGSFSTAEGAPAPDRGPK